MASASLEAPEKLRFHLVACGLAASFLIDFACGMNSEGGGWLVVAAALAVLCLKPRLSLFLTLLSLQVWHAWSLSPKLLNHWVLAALLGLGALTIWCSDPLIDDWWPAFARFHRWLLISFYAFAAFAKANSDFFDPRVSCVNQIYQLSVNSLWPGLGETNLPEAGTRILATLTLIVETLLPLFLLSRKTRVAAVGLAYLFHFTLGIGLPHISSQLLSGLVLFLPDRVVVELAKYLQPVYRRAFAMALSLAIALRDQEWLPHFFPYLWLIFVGGAGMVAVRSGGVADWQKPFRAVRLPPAAYLVLLLHLVNGLNPYFGGKTALTYTMYSNLRTEHQPNHWLRKMTHFDLFHWQRPLVQIEASNVPSMRKLIGTGLLIPEKQVGLALYRTQADGGRDLFVEYFEGNQRRKVTQTFAANWWQAKLLRFRAVSAQGPEQCHW